MHNSSVCRFSLIALALYAAQTWAEEKSELDKINVEEQIIPQNELYSPHIGSVATKVTTPLIRTPLSVTVITEKQIQDRNALNISDSLNYTAGLLSSYRGHNNELEISVRGIGNKSDGGGVPTYINGTSYQGSYELDPFFLESINVIKGPSSVLYGQSNPGGIVDIVTKKPTQTNRNLVQFKIGTRDLYQLGVDFDRRLNEQFSMRLVGNIKRLNWKENTVRQQGGTFAPSITWTPNEKTKWTLYVLYQKLPKAGDRNFLTRQGTLDSVNGQKIPYDFFASDPNFHKLALTQWLVGSQFQYQFNDQLTFRQNTRYSKSSNILHNLVVWDPVANQTELVRKARIFDDRWYELGADQQLEYKFQTAQLNHILLGGIEYKRSHYDLIAYLGDAPTINWANPTYGVSVTPPTLSNSEEKNIKQTGFYLQDQINWGNLDLLVGLRYDHAKNKTLDRRWKESHQQTDHKLTWRTGVIYNFANGIAPYLSYSTSFQPEVGLDANKKALKPTTAEQYEVGIKYQPTETILFTTALFNLKQKNLVSYDPQTRDKTQTGEVKTKGFEVSLTANFTPNIALITSYTYINKKVKKDKDSSLINTTPWGIPRHQASLWGKYGWTNGFLNGLNIGAGIRYIGSTQGNNQNTFTVPHYTLYDVSVGYDLSKVTSALQGADLQLSVQNLTNKKYVSSCANAFSCFYGNERTAVLTFNYHW
ncbi:TonB-dependent siderophore receptor [Pasteurellaceae bacterium LIM206]|nr:TonB-dependent siderophore receptor [Pasteurellaceae bacterium LIM206]